ncbi:Complex I intermediate-associated protein 30, mitochondrial [Kappamyces sp. JEL0680]|nr:Complex I intermediate-associated protein 30, mitochondrial [Kappamyces sp. JEL0680]
MTNSTLIVSYFKRSLDWVLKATKQSLALSLPNIADLPREKTLYTFDSESSLAEFIIGTDKDIGGESEAVWGLTKDKTGTSRRIELTKGLFCGNLSIDIPANSSLDKSGYVGLRSKQKPPVLFHIPTHDVALYRYLEVRARGNRFVQKNQLAMDKSQVKTVGFSLLRQPGPFELELAWIKAVNTLDTVGDFDVLKPGQFLDEATGEIRTLRPGEELGRTVPLWEGEKPEMYVRQPKDSTVQVDSTTRPSGRPGVQRNEHDASDRPPAEQHTKL